MRRTHHSQSDFGVYVHIPFCAKRCDYCAFATWTDKEDLFASYVEAVANEIDLCVQAGSLPAASSVFFGGGTPSLLPPDMLVSLLDRIPRNADCEVTVECNPDTVSRELFETYIRHGVNRVSFGVQSMVPHVLEALGRSHSPENVRAALSQASAVGLGLKSLDLIYGAVGESLQDWEHTVEEALSLQPGHISAYALTVEPNTALAEDRSRFPDDDDQADKYAVVDDALRRSGYENYEISNWAQPGMESRHNLLYWAQGNYRGFGCAAHSHLDGRRFWNVRTPERYIDLMQLTATAESASERLADSVKRLEALQLSLRTRIGVPVNSFGANDVEEFLDAGLAEVRDQQLFLTQSGRMMANAVSVRLLPNT